VNALLKKLLLVALIASSAPVVFGEPPKAAPAKPVPAQSVFVMPTSYRDGRDPFFPNSIRPYESNPTSKHTVDTTTFTVRGLSVEGGHSMVIINNHTFGVGDSGDVLASTGRVHLHVIEIRSDAVVIEVNGNRRELSTALK
jgi:hypothetical protein